MSEKIKEIIERIAGNEYSDEDLQVLVAAIQSKTIVITSGSQSIGIGESVVGSTIVTGDNSHVAHVYQSVANTQIEIYNRVFYPKLQQIREVIKANPMPIPSAGDLSTM